MWVKNGEASLTPDASLDIAIKEWAFSSDINLPIEPSETFSARITTFNGHGYDRVVADEKSIWIEIPKSKLNLSQFQPRQRTASRHYYLLWSHCPRAITN